MEWHALYKDREQNTWKFDMIHIRKGSRYDGVVEKVTAAIAERLTPEIRKTILQIKFDVGGQSRLASVILEVDTKIFYYMDGFHYIVGI